MNTLTNNACFGCGACVNVCKKNAIFFTKSNDGFFVPFVDIRKCNNCNRCTSVCPALNIDKFKSNSGFLSCKAVASDDYQRKRSSSGGLFYVLAKYVIDNQGYVSGVAWNEHLEAEHIIVSTYKDLEKLRFSKYVQSNTNKVFRDIKELLKQDKLVLFSGTPCQCAGLVNFLGRDYEKLIVFDFICHGVPSPEVWRDYLKTNFDVKNIVSVNFLPKNSGWKRCSEIDYLDANDCYIEYANGEKKPIGIYYKAFLKNVINNKICLNCKYRCKQRIGDFTGGDFFNLSKTYLDDGKGLSVCLINSKKANLIFSKIEQNFKFTKEVKISEGAEELELYQYITEEEKIRNKLFFEKYNRSIGCNSLLSAASDKKYDVALLSFFNGLNYGSVLVANAVAKIVEDLGYSVILLNKKFIDEFYKIDSLNTVFEFSRKQHFISKLINKRDDHRRLNEITDCFLVGSDTLWMWDDVSQTNDFYWLDFVSSSKKKISFCTSFAFSNTDIPEYKKQEIQFLYKRFDYLSTREKRGTELLKNIFGCDSRYFIDPTLMIDPSYYKKIADSISWKEQGYILAYILDLTKEKKETVEKVAKRLRKKVIYITNMYKIYTKEKNEGLNYSRENNSIEEFLAKFKNSDYVITDSFHGICFSIIFEKTFFAAKNKARGESRYEVFNDLNLNNRLFDSFSDIETANFEECINYVEAKRKIKNISERAIAWLKNSIEACKATPTYIDRMYDTLMLSKQKDYYNEIEIDKLKKKCDSLERKLDSILDKFN